MGSPLGEVAVDGARELGFGSIPLARRLEGDVTGGVVHHSEGAHPEMVPQPGHQPELEKACQSRGRDDCRQHHQPKCKHCCQADLHLCSAHICQIWSSAHEGLPNLLIHCLLKYKSYLDKDSGWKNSLAPQEASSTDVCDSGMQA